MFLKISGEAQGCPLAPAPQVAISKLNAIICRADSVAHTSAPRPRTADSMPQLQAAASLCLCVQRCVQTVTCAPGTVGADGSLITS